MNNIEILEEQIKHWKDLIKTTEISSPVYTWIKVDKLEEKTIALENLIQENKKLKEQMGKDLDVVYIKGIYDERDKWKNKIRDLITERKFELQQEFKDFKDDTRLNTLQEIYNLQE